MSDRINISVGLTADIQDFLSNLQKQFGNLKGLGLDKAAEKDVNNIMGMLKDLSKSISDLGGSKVNTSSFAKAQKEIMDKVQALETRTSALEKNMTSLVSTMSHADGGKFANQMKEIAQTMDAVSEATQRTVSSLSNFSNDAASRIDTIKSNLQALETILETVNKDFNVEMNFTSFKDAKNYLVNLYGDIQKAKKEASEIVPSTDDDVKRLAVVQQKIVELIRTFSEVYDQQLNGNFAEQFEEATLVFKEGGKNVERPFDVLETNLDKTLKNIVENVKGSIRTARAEIESLDNAVVGEGTGTSIGQGNRGLTVPLDISTKSSTILKRAIEIINVVNDNLKDNPVRAEVVLTTEWGTRKSNELLKQFQSQIDSLSAETDVSELRKLSEEISASFGNEINLKFKSNFDNEQKAIQKGIANLKREIKKGLEVNPKFKIADEDLAEFKTQINEITETLRVTVEKASSEDKLDVLDSQALKVDEESLSRIEEYLHDIGRFGFDTTQALKPLHSLLFEINTALQNNPLSELATSAKELVATISQIFNVGPANNISDIAVGTENLQRIIDATSKSIANETDNLKSLGEVAKDWLALGFEDNERATTYNRGSRQANKNYVTGSKDRIAPYLDRRLINSSSFPVTGAIHTHMYRNAAFSLYDTEKGSGLDIYKFFEDAKKGISQQIILALKDAMTINVDSLNISKENEIIDALTVEYEAAEKRLLKAFLNKNKDYIKETVDNVMESYSANDSAYSSLISEAKEKVSSIITEYLADESNGTIADMLDELKSEMNAMGKKDDSSAKYELERFYDAFNEPITREYFEQLQPKLQKAIKKVFSKTEFVIPEKPPVVQIERVNSFVKKNSAVDLKNEDAIKIPTEYLDDAEKKGSDYGVRFVKGLRDQIPNVQKAAKELADAATVELEKASNITVNVKTVKDKTSRSTSSSSPEGDFTADDQALQDAYRQADEYQKREAEYLKLRNQYLKEGQKQAQEIAKQAEAEAKAQQKAAEEYEKWWIKALDAKERETEKAAKAAEKEAKASQKVVSETQRLSKTQDIQKFMIQNKNLTAETRVELEKLIERLRHDMTPDQLKQIGVEFKSIANEARSAGETTASWADRWRKQLGNLSRYLTTFVSFYKVVDVIKRAFSTVYELDTALIDLRKTTTMTSDELNQFYFDANNVAKQMGVTTAEIINQASAWSRLGYSSKEAATEMAALSSQFAQISPGMSVENATDGLVSTMKAFHIDVADVEREVMDNVNIIGNRMATTNDEVVEMLKRSSAAMNAANNSLQETIALESAAVQITRNAETTGTAFRTKNCPYVQQCA